jgi:hypothetical protein
MNNLPSQLAERLFIKLLPLGLSLPINFYRLTRGKRANPFPTRHGGTACPELVSGKPPLSYTDQ